MLWALGAASGAIDLISSLTKSGSSNQSTGFNIGQTNGGGTGASAAGLLGGSGRSGALSSDTYAALLQTQSGSQSSGSNTQGSSAALQDLFKLIDGNSDGSISKSEFESALGAGGTNTAAADSVFGKLDSNGDGSVSINELASALKSGHHGQQAQGTGDADGDGDGSSSTSQAGGAGSSQGATTSTTTNSDGSTTTTISYADGSKVTMTSPASSSSSSGSGGNSAASSYGAIERMIQREADMLSKSASQTVSMSA